MRSSALSVIWVIDAIYGLATVHNMYTLKPTGVVGMLVNIVSLVVALGVFFGTPRGRRVLHWSSVRLQRQRLKSDSLAPPHEGA